MKAIAIDDEPIALDIIKSHASKVPYIQLQATFTDAFEALDFLQTDQTDLIFLDIKMPDISGIEFFNSLNKKPLVIFTTAYLEFAHTSFELDAVDYLVKPITLPRFLKGCNKAHELFNFRNFVEPVPDHLFIKTGYEQMKVMIEEILYLEATGNYVTFVLEDKKILSRTTFNEMVNFLPQEKFVRVHRSYLISINKVSSVGRTQISIGTYKVPISDSYRQDLTKILNKGN